MPLTPTQAWALWGHVRDGAGAALAAWGCVRWIGRLA